MATEMRRMTFSVTKEMEPLLDRAKKNLFCDRNQSEMIREIIMACLEVMAEKAVKENKNERTA